MPSEMDFITYQDFQDSLEPVETPSESAKVIACDATDGPVAVPANANALENAATESDMTEGNVVEVWTLSGKKKLDLSKVGKASDVAALQSAMGDAQSDITGLKSSVTALETKTNRELDIFSEEETINAYVSSNGSIIANDTNSATDFLKLSDFSSILVTCQNTDKKVCACYDEDKVFLNRVGYTEDYLENFELLDIRQSFPTGTKYVICFGWNAAHDPVPTKDFKVVTKYLGVKNEVIELKLDVSGLQSAMGGAQSDITGLKSRVTALETKTNRELDISSEEETINAYVSSNGSIIANDTNSATDFLKLSDFSSILVTCQNTDKKVCACYDEDKVFLNRVSYTEDYLENFELLDIRQSFPTGTKYVICFGWNAAHDPVPTKDFKVVTKYLGVKNEIVSIKSDLVSVNKSINSIGKMINLDDCGFVDGKSVNNTNGSINNSSNFAASGKISCNGAAKVIISVIITTYTVSQQGLAFYDKDDNFISGALIYQSQPENGVGEQTILVPSNAAYFRTTFWNTINRETYDYEFYGYIVGKFTEEILENGDSLNLNNIAFTDGGGVSANNGTIYSSQNMAYSGYVPCHNLKYLKISAPYHTVAITAEGLAFYDENKTLIGGGVVFQGEQPEDGVNIIEVSVPSNAAYFRTTFWNTTNRETYDYEFSCKAALKQFELGSAAFKNEDDFAKSHGVLFGSPTPYISEIPTDSVIDDITSEEFYTELDSYASSYEDIFHREDDIGEDSDGNGIRHYVLDYNMSYNTVETDVTNTLWQASQNPKHILLVSGVHGGEKTASVGALKFIEEVLISSEPWAVYIKTNFVIDYVPIVNVWGFDNFSRENKDGVNINRDFGTFATSEAAAIKDLVESIGENLIVGIDCHNNRWQGYIMLDRNSMYFDFVSKISYRIIASMRNMLTTLYNDTTKSPYYTLTDNPVVGCLSKWLEQEKGILATTAEAPRNTAMNGSTDNHASMMAITKSILANIIQSFGEFANK